MTCVITLWFLTVVFTAWLGAFVAGRYGQPKLLGAIVGLVFHLPGVFVLWLVLFLVDRGEAGLS